MSTLLKKAFHSFLLNFFFSEANAPKNVTLSKASPFLRFLSLFIELTLSHTRTKALTQTQTHPLTLPYKHTNTPTNVTIQTLPYTHTHFQSYTCVPLSLVISLSKAKQIIKPTCQHAPYIYALPHPHKTTSRTTSTCGNTHPQSHLQLPIHTHNHNDNSSSVAIFSLTLFQSISFRTIFLSQVSKTLESPFGAKTILSLSPKGTFLSFELFNHLDTASCRWGAPLRMFLKAFVTRWMAMASKPVQLLFPVTDWVNIYRFHLVGKIICCLTLERFVINLSS